MRAVQASNLSSRPFLGPLVRQALGGLAVIASLMAVSACGGGGGGGGGDSGAAPLVAPGRWVVLGSSTASGYGVAPGEGWVARLAGSAPAGVTIDNLAVFGMQTGTALQAGSASGIDAAVALQPSMLLLSFPSNDALAGLQAAAILANLQTMAQRARDVGAATVVLSSQPRNDLNDAQRTVLATLDATAATAFGACFVEVRSALATAEGRMDPAVSAGDGVHLNAEGHRRIHERVTAALATGRCVRLAP
jgi:lysophospholipase L1-like esterase